MAARRATWRNGSTFLTIGLAVMMAAAAQCATAIADDDMVFRRIPVQYIAALGADDATSGNNAQTWGLWRKDPGPRGVMLRKYDTLVAAGGVAPARWAFDESDWWLEENGAIMEPPDFSLPAGKYVVTGNREVITVLTVHPPASDGTQRWSLDDDANLYDVTHLRCRSARYTPAAGDGSCSPANAVIADFPVEAGAPMPPVDGCNKLDYTVLIVVGMGVPR